MMVLGDDLGCCVVILIENGSLLVVCRIWWESSKMLPRVWRKPVRCDTAVLVPRHKSSELHRFPAALFISLLLLLYLRLMHDVSDSYHSNLS